MTSRFIKNLFRCRVKFWINSRCCYYQPVAVNGAENGAATVDATAVATAAATAAVQQPLPKTCLTFAVVI